jgi:hypothetical protein
MTNDPFLLRALRGEFFYGKNVIFFSNTPAGFFPLLSAVMRNI